MGHRTGNRIVRPEGAQPEVVRRLLRALLEAGPCDQRELLAKVGRKRVENLMTTAAPLAAEGWLELAATAQLHGEHTYTRRTIALGRQAGWTLAAEVDREAFHCGLMDPHGQLRFRARIEETLFPRRPADGPGPGRLREMLVEVLGALVEKHESATGGPLPLAAIGVSWPARVDAATGEPIPFAPRPEWRGVSVRELVTSAVADALAPQGGGGVADVPLRIVNDCDAEAIAETAVGKSRNARVLMMVKVARGVGAALVTGGRVHRGAHGVAGEIGHVPVDVEAARRVRGARSEVPGGLDPLAACSCGGHGHLQCYASTAAIFDRMRAFRASASHGAAVDALDPQERAVDAVLREAGWLIGYALRGPAMMVDPDLVLVRVSLDQEAARRSLLTGVQAGLVHDHPPPRPRVELGTSTMPEAPSFGLVGAGVMAREEGVLPRVRRRAAGEPVSPVAEFRRRGARGRPSRR